MPYSIGFYFDQETESLIRRMWAILAELKLADYYHVSGNRPHITLGIFEEIDLDQVKSELDIFRVTLKKFSISFQQIGLFSGSESTVFWGPVVTRDLLKSHLQIHQLIGKTKEIPSSSYYLPGNWIPHCGLAMQITKRKNVSRIIEACQSLPNPAKAMVTEIGMIKFKPVEHLFSFHLPG